MKRSFKPLPRVWSLDLVDVNVTDRVILALSRAYGYRGNNADTAARVLDRHGYQTVPF